MHDAAEKLRKYRDQHALSYRAMADRCGLSAATLHRIEAKKCAVSMAAAMKLARILGVKNWTHLL